MMLVLVAMMYLPLGLPLQRLGLRYVSYAAILSEYTPMRFLTRCLRMLSVGHIAQSHAVASVLKGRRAGQVRVGVGVQRTEVDVAPAVLAERISQARIFQESMEATHVLKDFNRGGDVSECCMIFYVHGFRYRSSPIYVWVIG